MGFSKIDIWNLALSHLGVKQEVTSETEESDEAKACRRFYDLALEELLREFPWSFGRKVAELALIRENPNSLWSYEYRYPSDCVFLLRLVASHSQALDRARIPFHLSTDTAGRVIWTNMNGAIAEYTMRVDNPLFFTAHFVRALSYRLAGHMAMRFVRVDPGIARLAEGLYERSREEAQAVDAQEHFQEEPPAGDLLSARG